MHEPAPTAVVADDERLMREQIVGRLKEAWPELLIVGEAVNGRDAVAMVQSLEPDIAFLDINMPRDGRSRPRRRSPAKCNIVFVTAYDHRGPRPTRRGRLPVEAGGAGASPSRASVCASGCNRSPIR
jgi:chemotaxis response regulator CheB